MEKLYICFLLILSNNLVGQTFSSIDNKVTFTSTAPLETIIATSNELQGALDIQNKTFAFKLYIKSFDGFNSPLQKIHFYENFMETDQYPIALFKGKVLETIEADNNKYRAKGILNIHGVDIERVINVNLNIQGNKILFSSTFKIDLEDHQIDLPRIVYQKIAESIDVFVEGSLVLRP